MDKRQGLLVAILGGVLAILLIILTVLALNQKPDVIVSDFEAPPFDSNALVGIPQEVIAREDYRALDVNGNYTFSICGTLSFSDGLLAPYFASHGENEVLLRIKVYDIDGTELGKSGLIRPGEYVKTVALSRTPTGNTVTVKVLSYEPNTYYSHGTASATLPWFPNPS